MSASPSPVPAGLPEARSADAAGASPRAETVVSDRAFLGLAASVHRSGGPEDGPPGGLPVVGRYRLLRPLGAGGMGNVYEAEDSVLGRHVALKVLRHEEPARLVRFLHEARLQASLDHPHIGKVLDVGRLEDGTGEPHAYIAMPLVRGETLIEAGSRLTLREKVRVVEQVAAAVHEAHRAGLVHRDLKPDNVMVEMREGQAPHPYVLDFGLAREVAAPGLTATGVVVGTPAYMAPEQVRGETERVDRRTDVYALGVTCYELLAGRTPFESRSGLEALTQILHQDPPPLRRVCKEVPADLETIVMTCLAREPAHRYDTARALAEDLRRFLDGQAITAKRPSWLARGILLVRRNRVAAAVTAVALVALAALGTLLVRERWRASERAAHAQRFALDVKDLEWTMRLAHSLPPHDLGGEKLLVKERMLAIERRLASLGPEAQGPGEHALGRGYLALGDPARAREHLERAWSAGYREPEVALALGHAFGSLYRRGLRAAERLPGRALQEERKAQLATALRGPALAYLRQAQGAAMESPLLVEAEIRFFEGDREGALEKARAAEARSPWLSGARRLKAEILSARSGEERSRGEYEEAIATLALAGQALREARDVSRSDPDILLADCTRSKRLLETRRWGGLPVDEAAVEAREACGLVLRVVPGSSDARFELAGALWQLAIGRFERGQPWRELLAEAAFLAEEGVAREPAHAEGLAQLGSIWQTEGEYLLATEEDPRRAFDRSVCAFREAIALDANLRTAWNGAGNTWSSLGEWLMDRGQPASDAWREALLSFGRILAGSPGNLMALANAGGTLTLAGFEEMRLGRDPRPTLERARGLYEEALAANPAFLDALVNLGYSEVLGLEVAVALGEDPSAAFSRAEAAVARLVAESPEEPMAYEEIGRAYRLLAKDRALRGQEASDALRLSRESLLAALERNPGSGTARAELLRLETLELEQRPSDPAALARARRAANGLREHGPPDAFSALALAHLAALEAELGPRGRSAAAVDAGRRALDGARRINPALAETTLLEGRLLLAEARTASSQAARREAARRAAGLLGAACERNPLLVRESGAWRAAAERLSG